VTDYCNTHSDCVTGSCVTGICFPCDPANAYPCDLDNTCDYDSGMCYFDPRNRTYVGCEYDYQCGNNEACITLGDSSRECSVKPCDDNCYTNYCENGLWSLCSDGW
jgi:hypothetical protein